MSTVPDGVAAARIARTLVEESLAACVNVIPAIRSIYAWDGAVQDEQEVLMTPKTGQNACLRWIAAATRTPCE